MTISSILLFVFFCVSGSGSLAAMATFEDRFKPDMSVSKNVSVGCKLGRVSGFKYRFSLFQMEFFSNDVCCD